MSKMSELDMIDKDLKRLGYTTLDLLYVLMLRLNPKPETPIADLFPLARKESVLLRTTLR